MQIFLLIESLTIRRGFKKNPHPNSSQALMNHFVGISNCFTSYDQQDESVFNVSKSSLVAIGSILSKICTQDLDLRVIGSTISTITIV